MRIVWRCFRNNKDQTSYQTLLPSLCLLASPPRAWDLRARSHGGRAKYIFILSQPPKPRVLFFAGTESALTGFRHEADPALPRSRAVPSADADVDGRAGTWTHGTNGISFRCQNSPGKQTHSPLQCLREDAGPTRCCEPRRRSEGGRGQPPLGALCGRLSSVPALPLGTVQPLPGLAYGRDSPRIVYEPNVNWFHCVSIHSRTHGASVCS